MEGRPTCHTIKVGENGVRGEGVVRKPNHGGLIHGGRWGMRMEIMGLDYLPLERNILRDRFISSANGAGSPNQRLT